MERVQRTVEIKLTPEECEILWKAEQLLREMEKEISIYFMTKLLKNTTGLSPVLKRCTIVSSRTGEIQ